MKAIDGEASRERMNKVIAQLAKELAAVRYSSRAFVGRHTARICRGVL